MSFEPVVRAFPVMVSDFFQGALRSGFLVVVLRKAFLNLSQTAQHAENLSEGAVYGFSDQ